jgi:crossover junction endodeoxyribonuclease RuvC
VTGVVCGVDPGQTGAVAFITADGTLLDIFDMPVIGKYVHGGLLAAIIRDNDPVAAWIEQQQPMPRQAAGSTFTLGANWAAVVAVCQALHVPVHHVRPAAWKKAARLGADKNASRKLAAELWPANAATFARVKDHDRAEAALIARHGWTNKKVS